MRNAPNFMKNTLKGKWVFDTQLLIYTLNESSPFHFATKSLFELLISSKEKEKTLSEKFIGVVAQQNIIEAENVLIKYYKFNYKKAIQAIQDIIIAFNFETIASLPTTYLRFHSLTKSLNKKTVDIFDLYLVTTMLDNGITNIITVNEKDFAGIIEITVYNPFKEETRNA